MIICSISRRGREIIGESIRGGKRKIIVDSLMGIEEIPFWGLKLLFFMKERINNKEQSRRRREKKRKT
jgi:hypothetical protein